MSEPQYAHYKDIPRVSLGLMSNQLWAEDPKMLGIHLARYKFVAKMLMGKNKVAEIGCGDGFYSHIVAQEVEDLHGFDFDNSFISELHEGGNKNTFLHDILKAPLPNKFDAAYSLDVFEHINPKKADIYLRNICNSLVDKGVFILGCPSKESQAYASKASKIGHVNCMSGINLKAKLEKFFHHVFLFCFHDETLSTAFSQMAQYLMAICCDVR